MTKFFDLISDGSRDVVGLVSNPSLTSSATRAAVTAQFSARFGDNVVPVANLGESQEVEHLGKRGVVVNPALGAILALSLGSKDDLVKAAKEEVTRTLSWCDLSEVEQANLTDSIALVGAARPDCTIALVDVVDFRSPALMGQFKGGRLLVAHRLLADRDETLATLVHEFCHRDGGDGEKDHVMSIENLWRDIVKHLRGGK